MATEYRPLREDERDHMVEQTVLAFNLGDDYKAKYLILPVSDFRVIAESGKVKGALRWCHYGQFFGGRRIPVEGISAVQVSPESRGTGVARLLLRETLLEMYAEGVPLSSLYPSSATLYRSVGFEYAGINTIYRVPIRALPRGRGESVETWGREHLDEVRECYTEFALKTNGLLDRSPLEWDKMMPSPSSNKRVYRFMIRRSKKVVGYLAYEQMQEPDSLPYLHSCSCFDFVWTDQAAATALLQFLAASGPLALNVLWKGPPEEPLAGFMAQGPDIASGHGWMERIIHVEKALEARGYPQELKTAIEFSVADAILPQNNAAFRLEIKNGSARVSRVKKAAIQIDIGALSSLFTSWWQARHAAVLGRLTGATTAELDRLEMIFAGPRAWMFEVF